MQIMLQRHFRQLGLRRVLSVLLVPSALLFDKRVGASGLSGPISKVGALDTLYLYNPNASGVDVEVVIATK